MNKVRWRGGVENWWEVCGREYGDQLRQWWGLCDPGVAGGNWMSCRGYRVLSRVVKTGWCGCVCGMLAGIRAPQGARAYP